MNYNIVLSMQHEGEIKKLFLELPFVPMRHDVILVNNNRYRVIGRMIAFDDGNYVLSVEKLNYTIDE